VKDIGTISLAPRSSHEQLARCNTNRQRQRQEAA